MRGVYVDTAVREWGRMQERPLGALLSCTTARKGIAPKGRSYMRASKPSRCASGLAAQFGHGDAFPQPADA